MAAYRNIFILLAIYSLSLCQVYGTFREEEWLEALANMPWLDEQYNVGGDDDGDDDVGGDGGRLNEEELYPFSESLMSYGVGSSSYLGEAGGDEIPDGAGTAELRMPNVHPEKPDSYFCHSERMPKEEAVYIVGFEPLVTKGTAHHMLIYGCMEPGMDTDEEDNSWNCGEMDMTEDVIGEDVAPPCGGISKIIYAWAMDAPALELPQDVGIKVGADSGINYLVLQIHYSNIDKFKDGSTDHSGIGISWTLTPQPLSAGVYFMGSDGEIPAHSQDVHLESGCEYKGSQTMHPFAFRVHTHKLGQVVSGYRVREDVWTEIGKRDPQLPQMFQPIDKDIPVVPGDTLAMRCTFASDRNHTTKIGMTGKDEMCNFYIMFYTEEGGLPKDTVCYQDGYKMADHLANVPDEEASRLTSNSASNSM